MFGLFNLALYYLAAVIAFSFLWEKWTIIDSVYFATVTFTSVGEYVSYSLPAMIESIVCFSVPHTHVISTSPNFDIESFFRIR